MIEIINSGFYTSIQDKGRIGFKNFGVPISGAMDQHSFSWSNRLLNNLTNSAVLEMSFKGPKICFHEDTFIAITGAFMGPKLNGFSLEMNKPIGIKKMDILQFGNAIRGSRTYLSVLGGLQTQKILGSRSQFKGITTIERISKRTVIPIKKLSFNLFKGAVIKHTMMNFDKNILTAYEGPEFNLLPENIKHQLSFQKFHLSHLNNRMGYQLKEKITIKLPQIWTAPVLPGTVQCTPEGKLIILMQDAQVTGGYSRLLQLDDDAINCLAQKGTNDLLQFRIKKLT